MTSGGYRLAGRANDGVLLGLHMIQLLLVAAGLAALVLLPTKGGGIAGLTAGAAVTIICVTVAFGRIGTEPVYRWLPIVGRFLRQKLTEPPVWMAPLPLLTGTPPAPVTRPPSSPGWGRTPSAAALPRCLTGLEIVVAERPLWAGSDTTLAPVGVVRDRRRETLTVIMGARGSHFALRESDEQHAQLGAWGRVLAQFAREVSPVVRIGWSLWSSPVCPGVGDGHMQWLESHRSRHRDLGAVSDAYQELLNETLIHQHDLRIWITIAAGPPEEPPHRVTGSRRARKARPSAVDAALGAARALTDRGRAAGLVVTPPFSPVQIAETVRVQADPTVRADLAPASRGLPARAGVASVLMGDTDPQTAAPPTPNQRVGTVPAHQVAPLAVDARWHAVRMDGSWHRAFWVAQWPSTVTDPRWLQPLLLDPPGARTLAVSYDPISPRASRRTITAEAVSIDSQLQLRERHDLRVPVGLQRAHSDIDQRETELARGHAEVAMLALIVLTETSLDELDLASQVLLDQVAQAGITDLRPLHARHDAAWACALPIGRSPNRELLRGMPG